MYGLIKRTFDIAFALLALILLFPISVLIALAIVLESPGPVLFQQIRIGKNGQPFKLYKFRTMQTNTDLILHRDYIKKLIDGELGPERGAPVQKMKNDPRVTSVGRFLRKTSLDELPQIINILIGNMTLVGPRPAIPFEVEHYKEWHKERLKGKPGLTGISQVYGREGDFDQGIKMDIEYLANQSFLLDFKIILKTISYSLSGKGY